MDRIKIKLKDVKEDELLAKHTTFKIGGPAQYFFIAKTSQDIVKAVKAARQLKIPYFLLGGGSNILIADKGVNGLVIKTQNSKISAQDEKTQNNCQVLTDSGVKLNQLVAFCIKKQLTGMEWAAGIPGTVGGAVLGNAGTKDGEMKDVLVWVKALDKNNKIVQFNQAQCQFAYRDSIFKHDGFIILESLFKLKSGSGEDIQRKVKENIKKRQQGQPYNWPSAGCIFKNPSGESAGRLIEEAGLKGQKMGGAVVSEKHANFIVNTGSATAEQVIMLISLIKQKVRTKFNIQLQEEIQYIGF